MYAQNNTLLSANNDQLDLYSGKDTVFTTNRTLYANVANNIQLNTPIVQVLTQLDTPSASTINLQATNFKVNTNIDTPSISTINFQATNFLTANTTVVNETVTGTLTANTINATNITSPAGTITTLGATTGNIATVNSMNVNATTVGAVTGNITTVNATTVGASVGNIPTINATTVGATNVNTTTTTLQNIKGNPDISISTGNLLLQTTINEPVVITTNFSFTGADQFWTCPAGVNAITITVSGAGGGTNTTGAYTAGGKGGYVSGQLGVQPGLVYKVVVGEGGGVNPAGRLRYGGGGQGATTGCDGGGGTFIIDPTTVVLACAGGGGGGAALNSSNNNLGGAGGGLVGGTGGGSDPAGGVAQTGGNGGTQSAAGTTPTAPNNPGNNGSGKNGGAGIFQTGAGGGGYYGGASGGFNAPSPDSYGAGGGGSSWATILGGTVVNTQGGGAGPTKNGTASISYQTTAVAPNVIFDAYVDVNNKLTFNNKSIVTWQQSLSESQTGTSFYQTAWTNVIDPASGNTFSPTQYVMTSALSQTGIGQPYAVATSYVQQRASGGVYQIQGTLYSATAALPTDNRTALWTVQITMIPIELCPGGIVSQVPPSTINTATPLNNPELYLSSITGKLLTVKATEDIGLIAGLNIPTFLGNGSIAINASTNVDLMANYDITAGAGHDFNATATSNIRLTSPYIKLDRTGGGNLILDTNVDMNCANGRFLTLGNSGGGSYFQIQSGGAQVLTVPAGQSITLDGLTNVLSNIEMNTHNINSVGVLSRRLISSDIPQPIIQTGLISTSSSSGTQTVNIPQRYTNATSYYAYATPQTDHFGFYCSNVSRGSFTIGWQGAGGGTNLIAWQTMGT
jgi:hypothetical protein